MSPYKDKGIKSQISVCELIYILKKCTGGAWMLKHFPQILTSEERATTTSHTIFKIVTVIPSSEFLPSHLP